MLQGYRPVRIGRLENRWIDVHGLRMHVRVSTEPVSSDVPTVVLVHGVGISSRYMVPTVEGWRPTTASSRPICPASARAPSPTGSVGSTGYERTMY